MVHGSPSDKRPIFTKMTPLKTCAPARIYYAFLEHLILPALERTPLTPTQITFGGLLLALLVPVGFMISPLLGLLALSASGIADSLDGLMARRHKCITPVGAFLDSSLDRLSDACYLAGFWVMFRAEAHGVAADSVIFLALVFTLMISYVKARAEVLGCQCQVGVMERGARVLYLIAWTIMLLVTPHHRSAVLWSGLLIYCALALGTVLQRMTVVIKQLKTKL